MFEAAARKFGQPPRKEPVEPFAGILGPGRDRSFACRIFPRGVGHRFRDWTETVQPLKALVIVMGVMIVVGVGIVAVTIVQRLGNRSVAGRNFEAASLTLPKGCHVVDMAAAGARLALRLGDSPDCQ